MGAVLLAYKSRQIALHEPVDNFYNRPNENRHTGFGRGSTQHAETIHISPAAVAKNAYTFVEDTHNDWHSVRLAVAREEVGILPRISIPGKSSRTRRLGILPRTQNKHFCCNCRNIGAFVAYVCCKRLGLSLRFVGLHDKQDGFFTRNRTRFFPQTRRAYGTQDFAVEKLDIRIVWL